MGTSTPIRHAMGEGEAATLFHSPPPLLPVIWLSVDPLLLRVVDEARQELLHDGINGLYRFLLLLLAFQQAQLQRVDRGRKVEWSPYLSPTWLVSAPLANQQP